MKQNLLILCVVRRVLRSIESHNIVVAVKRNLQENGHKTGHGLLKRLLYCILLLQAEGVSREIYLVTHCHFVVLKCLLCDLEPGPAKELRVINVVPLLVRMHDDGLQGKGKRPQRLHSLLLLPDGGAIQCVPYWRLNAHHVEASIGGGMEGQIMKLARVNRCIHVPNIELRIFKKLHPRSLSLEQHIFDTVYFVAVSGVEAQNLILVCLDNTSDNLIAAWIPRRTILGKPLFCKPRELFKIVEHRILFA